jgi:hypothetical protein
MQGCKYKAIAADFDRPKNNELIPLDHHTINRAEEVWAELAVITHCTSPDGSAELEQVRFAYERAKAAEDKISEVCHNPCAAHGDEGTAEGCFRCMLDISGESAKIRDFDDLKRRLMEAEETPPWYKAAEVKLEAITKALQNLVQVLEVDGGYTPEKCDELDQMAGEPTEPGTALKAARNILSQIIS